LSLELKVVYRVDFLSSELVNLTKAFVIVSNNDLPGDERGVPRVVSDRFSEINTNGELMAERPERVNSLGKTAGQSGVKNLHFNVHSYQSVEHGSDKLVSVARIIDFAKINALIAMKACSVDEHR
jgi:hypothetical protein